MDKYKECIIFLFKKNKKLLFEKFNNLYLFVNN
jgi:hypothetical protein